MNCSEDDDRRASSEDGGHQTHFGECLAEFVSRYPMGDEKQATGYLNRSMLYKLGRLLIGRIVIESPYVMRLDENTGSGCRWKREEVH